MYAFEPIAPSVRVCTIATLMLAGGISAESAMIPALRAEVCHGRVLAGLSSALRRVMPQRVEDSSSAAPSAAAFVHRPRVSFSLLAWGHERASAARRVGTSRIGGLYGP